jgi:hypothetical protein
VERLQLHPPSSKRKAEILSIKDSVFTDIVMFRPDGGGAYKNESDNGRFIMTLAPGSISSTYSNVVDKSNVRANSSLSLWYVYVYIYIYKCIYA